MTRRRAILPWLWVVASACGGSVTPGDGAGDIHVDADAPLETPETTGEDRDVDRDEADAAPDGADEEEIPSLLAENWDRDILLISLVVDLVAMRAQAVIDTAASEAPGASFEAQGLEILDVSDGEDRPLEYRLVDGRLDVAAPAGAPARIAVEYGFSVAADFEGYMDTGVTLTWPYFCGNLFPCHSWPAEGQRFDLQLSTVPDGLEAIYPDTIAADAPAYQLAWAAGEYTYKAVGTTFAGTEVGFWYLPGGEVRGDTGTADLPAVFDWLESTLGPYPFGSRVGAVEVEWGPGAIGGMEHHPYWHVSTSAMADGPVQIHEATHGWFGDGVRLSCWEDFVLSEGTATYLAARATGQAVGAAEEADMWTSYDRELDLAISREDTIAWPDSCGEVDILASGLFSRVPYMKGAFFYRAVAVEVGANALDGVLASFFEAHVGQPAGMQDMLDLILSQTGFDPSALADGWLRNLGRPDR
jgi:hypothetical protein